MAWKRSVAPFCVGAMAWLLVGCASNGPASTQAATPSAVAVHGLEACQIVDAVYEGNTDRERFHCQETNSDERLNGEWESWIITEETGGGLGSWTGEFVMTNPGGTWRGQGTGTTTGIPASPMNLGLVVWVGEDGYAGLTYHEFVHGSNGRLETAGWIEPT